MIPLSPPLIRLVSGSQVGGVWAGNTSKDSGMVVVLEAAEV